MVVNMAREVPGLSLVVMSRILNNLQGSDYV